MTVRSWAAVVQQEVRAQLQEARDLGGCSVVSAGGRGQRGRQPRFRSL